MGLCKCGCGSETISKDANYLQGHRMKVGFHNFGGEKTYDSQGNAWIKMRDHHRANHQGYVLESVLVVEKAMGTELRRGAIIHHWKRKMNFNKNLLVCNDDSYHKTIHQRMRSFLFCGHAHWRKCKYCGQYDEPENMVVKPTIVFHRQCRNRYARGIKVDCSETVKELEGK